VLLLFWLFSLTLQQGLPGATPMLLQLSALLMLVLEVVLLLLLPCAKSCSAACSSKLLGLRQGSAAFAVMTFAL
jgi:hypothetical protein